MSNADTDLLAAPEYTETPRIDDARVGDRVRSFDFVGCSMASEGVVIARKTNHFGDVIYSIRVDTEWFPINETERDAPARAVPVPEGVVESLVRRTIGAVSCDEPFFVNLSR